MCRILHVPPSNLLTTGDLAAESGWDRTTVHKKLADLGIEPKMVAGRTRLFPRSVLRLIGTNPRRTTEAAS